MKTSVLMLPLLLVFGCGASSEDVVVPQTEGAVTAPRTGENVVAPKTREEFAKYLFSLIEPKLGKIKRPEARDLLVTVLKRQNAAPPNLSKEDVDWAYDELAKQVREFKKSSE